MKNFNINLSFHRFILCSCTNISINRNRHIICLSIKKVQFVQTISIVCICVPGTKSCQLQCSSLLLWPSCGVQLQCWELGLAVLERSGWNLKSCCCCWCRAQLGLTSSWESDRLCWPTPSRGAIMRPQNPYHLHPSHSSIASACCYRLACNLAS